MNSVDAEEIEKLEGDIQWHFDSMSKWIRIKLEEDHTEDFQNIIVKMYSDSFDDDFSFCPEAFDTYDEMLDYCISKVEQIYY